MRIYKIASESANSSPMRITGDLYVGIDMHLKSWHVTILHEGVKLFCSNITGGWDVLKKLLDRYSASSIQVAYEAGCFGVWLYDALLAYGARCTVVPPSLILQESGNKTKTDRIDSTKLAFLLSKGMLKAVYVPSPEQRGHQEVFRRRIQLVADRVNTQLRIKAFIRLHNLPLVEQRGRWSAQFMEDIHRWTCSDPWLMNSFQMLVVQLDALNAQIEQQTRLIQTLADLDCYRENVRLLRTIPGVGLLISMEILLELQDIRRFTSSGALSAYVGLTPSQYSSGEHIRLGRITRTGKAHLRAMLVEACWILIGKDPVLAKHFNALKSRAGAKRAIVAIARKLLIRVRRILLDRTAYVIGKTI